ncbi:MAG: hypothetical protein CVV24_01820, partial [Ignavibacteriae bacterium HGW-Ignavibacteriae-3]
EDDIKFLENEIDLNNFIKFPAELSDNLFKCRVLYSDNIHDVEFHPYTITPVNKLYAVYDDGINYDHKYENRSAIQKLLCKAGDGEILIVKNGYITDSSYANVVFSYSNYFITPSTPLLKGTKRELLLKSGKIREEVIRLVDISQFEYCYLINAMIDLEDEVRISIKNIVV